MASNLTVCEVDDDAKKAIKKFRFRKEKNNAAIIFKIIKEDKMVVIEEEMEDVTVEEVQEELSDHQPRFLVFSYVYDHGDGRVSYPLCFIYICPQGAHPELTMMYAGSKTNLVKEFDMTKVFELRSVEEFTENWLLDKLKLFK